MTAPAGRGRRGSNGGWNAAVRAGVRYGDLVAEERVGIDPNSGGAVWRCRCVRQSGGVPCGNEKDVRGSLLENRQVKSCGCRRRARGAERTPRVPASEMLGKVYGRLRCEELLPPAGGNDRHRWRCDCLGGGPGCSGSHVARANDLRSGNTKSCGCLAGRGGGKGLRKAVSASPGGPPP